MLEDRVVLRALAAHKLADIALSDPDASWVRFALEAVLKGPVDAP